MSDFEEKVLNRLDIIIENMGEFLRGLKESKTTFKKVELEVKEEIKSDIKIEYQGRTYSKFKPCKYKCSYWTSWADDYKKGDKILHINPMTKEVIGFDCPKFNEVS